METCVIAKIKDNILQTISQSLHKRKSLEDTYINLNIEKLPIKTVRGFVYDMEKDQAISCSHMPSGQTLLVLRPLGEKIIKKGGYFSRFEEELKYKNFQDEEIQKYRERADLEIEKLKADALTPSEAVKALEKQELKDLQDSMRRITYEEYPEFDKEEADELFKWLNSQPRPPK